MNTPYKVLIFTVIVALLVPLISSCSTGGTAEHRAIKRVMATVKPDVPERDFTAAANPEGAGWVVTSKGGAKYLVRDDKVYAINGMAMTWSPGIPNVRDEKITDCPGGYPTLTIFTEEENETLSKIPVGRKKEIYYELLEYQDENPGVENARKSHGIIADRYGITKDTLNLIMREGFEERWPEPAAPD